MKEMTKRELRLSVNRGLFRVEVLPSATLLDVLRDELGLTGAKRGCETGYCGCCTVLLDGKAIHSCSILAFRARDHEVLTIEGLEKDGELHPIQKAFLERGASQCGYCSPGMILSAKALLDSNPKPNDSELRRALSGNLCRCTGYNPIMEAVTSVVERGERK